MCGQENHRGPVHLVSGERSVRWGGLEHRPVVPIVNRSDSGEFASFFQNKIVIRTSFLKKYRHFFLLFVVLRLSPFEGPENVDLRPECSVFNVCVSFFYRVQVHSGPIRGRMGATNASPHPPCVRMVRIHPIRPPSEGYRPYSYLDTPSL